MLVTNLQTQKKGSIVRYSADFLFDEKFFSTTIWFEVSREHAPPAFPEDSFLCVAYPLALTLKEDLYFHGSVSKKLYENLSLIGAQVNLGTHRISIIPDKIQRRKKLSSGSSQFFTLGVDSFYTLLHLEKRKKLIDHTLLYAFGYDIMNISQSLSKKVKKKIRETANHFSVHEVFVNTNLRDLSELIVDWGYYHGAALAGIAHLFPQIYGTVFFNSSSIHTEGILWGTHEYADHLWSSEAVRCDSYGTDTHRVKKIAFISGHKDFFFVNDQLRVCWENLGKKNAEYNCSHCEKCLRTHLAFALYGQRKLRTFSSLDLSYLTHFHIEHQDEYHWRALYHLSQKKLGANSDITAAIHNLLLANRISLS